MKKLLLILLALLVSVVLISCGEEPVAHTCANACPQCGLCLNAACTEAVCAEKCQGHHSCADVCDQCGLCLNADCAEAACANKCQGHHNCANVCDQCGLCLNVACTEAVCAEKCQCKHTCVSICARCNRCLNASCKDVACMRKCPGHHDCANVCPQCQKCTNLDCSETVCRFKCQGHHECTDPCAQCGWCQNADCAESACAHKCQGHWEEPYIFPTGDYVTDTEVHIDTGTLVFDIGENVYVRGDLAELAEKMVASMEKVAGLDFDGAGYAKGAFADGKVHVQAGRNMVLVESAVYSEYGNAYAGVWDHAVISPGNLFNRGYVIIHELGHVMMFRQSEWCHSQLLNEGFAEYTAYLALLDLAETDPAWFLYVNIPERFLNNMRIYDYDALYAQPLEYWFENIFESSDNANYSIGFRFMAYLQDVYGDYSKWITEFEKTYCFREIAPNSNVSAVEHQITALKATYGEDVLDNFYPWLQEHEDIFEGDYREAPLDLRGTESVNWYPVFNGVYSRAEMNNLQYKDLYVNLNSMRQYLTEYKGFDSSDLQLVTSEPIYVRLYQADGSYTTVYTDQPISLEGVAYIKLVGEGSLESIRLEGSFRWERYPKE